MYYGKIWLVVKPTVGLPLFFGGVAITALIVHAAVLTHTAWFPAFLNGNQHVKVAAAAAPAEAGAPAAAGPSGSAAVIINVGPGGTVSK